VKHLFPPLLPKEGLQPPVLAVVAHPDDEVISCGAMLAWHRAAGHPVTVVHMTDGGAGDPDGRFGEIAQLRRAEGREALARLGVHNLRSVGLPDGELPEHAAEVAAELRSLFEMVAPRTVYTFFFGESHRDHRAVSEALVTTADALPEDCRVLLFGVNQPVPGATMFDVTDLIEQKQHALAAFASQLAYNDFALKIRHRDHAATVNIEDPAVQYAESFADLRPGDLAAVRDHVRGVYHYLFRETR